MRDLLLDLFRRFSSRKFIAMLIGLGLILLDGYDQIELTDTVLASASAAIVLYIGVEGSGDVITRWRNGTADTRVDTTGLADPDDPDVEP